MIDVQINFWESVKDSKKVLILKAALVEFAQKGFNAASTRDIAKQAGIANGLMFYHFANKEALFLTLSGLVRETIREYLYSESNTENEFFDKLDALSQKKLLLKSKYPEAFKILVEYLHVFPNKYAEDGRLLRAKYPLFENEPLNFVQRATMDALEGLTDRLIAQHQAGLMSLEDLYAQGMEESSRYIHFFKAISDTPPPN